ncbi:MAG TPA: histidine phosphatase family protein [Candidatus Binatia bacterium]|nr:histidine phosphatase family protein [Candidatus Binatia bacterium]
MGWPRLLVLVRHAESLGNTMTVDERAGFDMSSHLYPITERGRAQAAVTARWLKERYGTFDVRYVSYYSRSKETMAILCPGERVYEDPRLAEAQRGMYHVLTKQQQEECYPAELERKKREGLYHYRPFGGENWPDIELRIHSFLGTLTRDYDGHKVLIVVHGHWLILFQRLMQHYAIEEAMRRYHGGVVENVSATVYEGRGPWWWPWRRDRLCLVAENIVPWKGIVT